MQISRVNRPKNKAKKAYDRMSRFYDLLAGASENTLTHLGVESLGAGIGDRVLEIGCGTGQTLVQLSRNVGVQGFVCGLDLSEGMLRVAGSRLLKEDLEKNVHLLCGDGAALPFTEGEFSCVFMSFTLELFDTPEIPLVLAECWRMLKSGGRLGVVAMNKPDHDTPVVRLYEWFHGHFPTYIDCRPIHADSMIQEARFNIEQQQIKYMWGLPVSLLLARKE